MRINRTVATAMSIAMLATLSLTACGDDEIKSVTIGNQTWMAKNLNIAVEGSKCFANSEENCQKYGRLYDWETAMKACPSGWHLPSDAEWNALMKSINPSCSDNENCAGAGTKLKAKSNWDENGNGTDDFGFSALPGGIKKPDGGNFGGVGQIGYWWSATDDASEAYFRFLGKAADMGWNKRDKKLLCSVRCIKD
jgi:uncharacterized protein (TIGR02145 family)